MQAESTLDRPAPPREANARSFTKAFEDIAASIRQRQLWAHLGWQDIKQRYRRSVIGPLWITISMAVVALALGLLNSVLMGQGVAAILPSITVGLITWNFISGCMTEGSNTFISNEGLIKQLPAPVMVYILRTVWRQFLLMGHNMIVYLLVLAVFFTTLIGPYSMVDGGVEQPGLNWSILLAAPALVVLLINGVWVALLFGVVATRFRDIPPLISSLIQMVFYMSPIMYSMDQVVSTSGDKHPGVIQLLRLNPVYHFIEIFRAPLLGQQQAWTHWVVVGAFTVAGWGLALMVLRNYRARVAYWV